MTFIRRVLEGNENKWLWFVVTIFGSAIPIVLRVIISFDSRTKWFDLKDLLFMGLAVNLSNFSLVGARNYKPKSSVSLATVVAILFLGFSLGIVLVNGDCDTVKHPLNGLTVFSVVVVLLSVVLSYEANRYIFESEKLTL